MSSDDRNRGSSGKIAAQLYDFLAKCPDGMIVVDSEKKVRFINPAALSILGYEKKDLQGMPLPYPVEPGRTSEISIERWHGVLATVRMRVVNTQWEGEQAFLVLIQDISDRKREEQNLREERDFSASLVQNSPAFFVALSPEGKTLMMNDAMVQGLGYTLDEVLGEDYPEMFLSGDERERMSAVFESLERLKKPSVSINRVRAKDGRELLVEWHIKPVMRSSGGIHYFLNLGIDITERRRAEAQLKESEARYRSLLEATFEGVAVHEQGTVLDVNRAFEDMFGYAHAQAEGMSVMDFIAEESRERFVNCIKEKGEGPFEAICRKKDGSLFHAEIRGKSHSYKGRFVRVIILRDITELVRLRERLLALSHVDELTSLSNRRGFHLLAQQQIRLANRTKKGLVLLFIDLDGLKAINDELGHGEGDLALVDTANVLRKTMRQSDIIARLGGDEFVVLAIEAVENSVEIIKQRLENNIAGHNAKGERRFTLSLSIGSSYYDPKKSSSIEDLIQEADRMMYEHKRRKKEGPAP